MGQVAFDTLKFVETLESAGLPKNQAKAISLAVRESHEAVDVATKADIAEVNRNIADVRKDLSAEMNLRFERVDAQISDVRKDMAVRFEKTDGQIALIRKDVETIATGLLLKLGGVIVVTISAATAILKFF
ncbi:hypothetical protein QE197_24955 (plasmid) [Arsenophonus nasoniae]|uniref:DUF1640 domain-containing protein n=1 Tax=Arsenophonus nasoniae TaxID=638 RepID=A0A4V1BWK5_9GAMM|nr:hypothetical protein [Arsenophonus nasoniae]QBY42513.1 hypothetical protein ArsFIN_10650 [Arsenophonus nasoniae]QBY44446.1 hypothetical protein ArsFIN_30320 [Arsenophonus nasoniae]WGM00660.1 hypothetical protein QE210_12430 [Arsenophonus nasoniae]WGM04702.1 hypothetical protein QE258_13970 [Arsenophonus nasoniae]WGM06622.1 hypothetical protein QE258_04685 [Arsenophonus nasoniae]